MDKIKSILTVIASLGAAIFAALFYRQKAKTEQVKREASETARKIEQKADKALVMGMVDEQKIRKEIENNPVDDIDLT